MSFHDVQFPTHISQGARGGPMWSTDIVTLASGAEQRNSRWANSRRRYDVGYGVKSKSDLRELISFFEERRGSFHSFRFLDPLDHLSGEGAVTALDQMIGVGDGTRSEFQLTKTYGGQFDPWVRAITKPVVGSVQVAVDGMSLAAHELSVDANTGLVTLLAPPASGQQVTAGFAFDVPVRFETDQLDVEITNFDAAIAPSIKLIEVR
jgi:uncharacterized protein (TIGR02217 family)